MHLPPFPSSFPPLSPSPFFLQGALTTDGIHSIWMTQVEYLYNGSMNAETLQWLIDNDMWVRDQVTNCSCMSPSLLLISSFSPLLSLISLVPLRSPFLPPRTAEPCSSFREQHVERGGDQVINCSCMPLSIFLLSSSSPLLFLL